MNKPNHKINVLPGPLPSLTETARVKSPLKYETDTVNGAQSAPIYITVNCTPGPYKEYIITVLSSFPRNGELGHSRLAEGREGSKQHSLFFSKDGETKYINK
jgi:hypothetical protein